MAPNFRAEIITDPNTGKSYVDLPTKNISEMIVSEMENAGLHADSDRLKEQIAKHMADLELVPYHAKDNANAFIREMNGFDPHKLGLAHYRDVKGKSAIPFVKKALEAGLVNQDTGEVDGMSLTKAIIAATAATSAHKNLSMFSAAAGIARDAGWEQEAKALEASSLSGGGVLLSEGLYGDFISKLYDASPLRQLGAKTIEMTDYTMKVGGLDAPPLAYWVGESQAITSSEVTMKQRQLTAKKLGIIILVSKELLRFGQNYPMGLVELLRMNAIKAAAAYEGSGLLRGTGDPAIPQGIMYQIPSTNSFNANTTVNIQNVVDDMVRAMYKPTEFNSLMTNPAWIMAPRSLFFFDTLLSTDGRPALDTSQGTLWGHKVGTTNSIPVNLDTSTGGLDNETDIMFGDMDEVLIGQKNTLEFELYNEATVNTTQGLVRLMQQDLTAVQLIAHADVLLLRPEAWTVTRQVRWGSALSA